MELDTSSGSASGGGEQIPVNNQRLNFRCESKKKKRRKKKKRAHRRDREPQQEYADQSELFNLGDSAVSREHDNDRDIEVFSFRYNVGPRMQLIMSVTSPEEGRVSDLVTIKLVSNFSGLPYLAKLTKLTLIPSGGNPAWLDVTWYKQEQRNATYETLAGTMNVVSFVTLMKNFTTMEVRGENLQFALATMGIQKLGEFSSYLATHMASASPTPESTNP